MAQADYYLKLEDGSEFVTRQQNSWEKAADFKVGERVGIDMEEGASRVLRD